MSQTTVEKLAVGQEMGLGGINGANLNVYDINSVSYYAHREGFDEPPEVFSFKLDEFRNALGVDANFDLKTLTDASVYIRITKVSDGLERWLYECNVESLN